MVADAEPDLPTALKGSVLAGIRTKCRNVRSAKAGEVFANEKNITSGRTPRKHAHVSGLAISNCSLRSIRHLLQASGNLFPFILHKVVLVVKVVV